MATTTRRAVYCDGVWDLFHAGHLEFLQNVRSAAARDLGVANAEIHLVCGVVTDEDTASYKRLPVVPHAQRVVVSGRRHRMLVFVTSNSTTHRGRDRNSDQLLRG